MIFREALVSDIRGMQNVRNAVRENVLSDPALVSDADCEEYISVRGKGWVCETESTIVAFAIADLKGKSIWALFIDPFFEGRGIGSKLHDMMMDWMFSQTEETIWLSTAPGTRAEKFYAKTGWKNVGMKNKEAKFEMSFVNWQSRKQEFAK